MAGAGSVRTRTAAAVAGVALAGLLAWTLWKPVPDPTPRENDAPTARPATPSAGAPAEPEAPVAAPSAPAPPSATGAAAPAPTGPAAAATTTGFSVEVVDEHGARVTHGTLRVEPPLEAYALEELIRALVPLRDPVPLAESNPVVRDGLPASLAGLTLKVIAEVEGYVPTEAAVTPAGGDAVVAARLVVSAARHLEVFILDAATGAPVAGARVLSLTEVNRRRIDPEDSTGDRGTGWGTTDAAGRVLVGDLGAGPHKLEIAVAGYRALQPVAVDPGAGARTFRIEPLGGRGGTLRATVRGPDGVGLEGFPVKLRLFDRERPVVVRSDSEGIATFRGIPAGDVLVMLDRAFWSRAATDRNWPGDRVAEMGHVMPLGEGETQGVVLGYRGGSATVTVDVVAADGAAAPGIEVMLAGPAFRTMASDAEGRCVFSGVSAGKFVVGTGTTDGRMWVDPDERVLAEGASLALRVVVGNRTIPVRVLRAGPSESPVERAFILVRGKRHSMGHSTEADGRTSIPGAAPGEYEVTASADGFPRASARLVVPADRDPEPLEIRLVRGGRIVLRVASGAAAPADADLRVVGPDGEETYLRRDGTGENFRETGWVPPGVYTVEVRRADGTTARQVATVRAGEDATVELGP